MEERFIGGSSGCGQEVTEIVGRAPCRNREMHIGFALRGCCDAETARTCRDVRFWLRTGSENDHVAAAKQNR